MQDDLSHHDDDDAGPRGEDSSPIEQDCAPMKIDKESQCDNESGRCSTI